MDCAPGSCCRPVSGLITAAGCSSAASAIRGRRLAVLELPAFQHPGGEGEFGGAIRPADRRAIHFTQYGVDKSRGGSLVRLLTSSTLSATAAWAGTRSR